MTINRYLLEIKRRNDPFKIENSYYISLYDSNTCEEIVMDFYIALYLNIEYKIYNELKLKYNGIYDKYDCISYFYSVDNIINFQNILLDLKKS